MAAAWLQTKRLELLTCTAAPLLSLHLLTAHLGKQHPTLSTSPPCLPHHPFRLRTPNEWEPLGHWQDVLMWRNTIYNIVITAFRGYADVAPQLHQLGYRDKAWSVNRWGCSLLCCY